MPQMHLMTHRVCATGICHIWPTLMSLSCHCTVCLHFHGVGDVEPPCGVDQLVPLDQLLHFLGRQGLVSLVDRAGHGRGRRLDQRLPVALGLGALGGDVRLGRRVGVVERHVGRPDRRRGRELLVGARVKLKNKQTKSLSFSQYLLNNPPLLCFL